MWTGAKQYAEATSIAGSQQPQVLQQTTEIFKCGCHALNNKQQKGCQPPSLQQAAAMLESCSVHARRSSKGHTVSNTACNADGTLAACAAGRTLHAFELQSGDFEARR